MTETQTLPGFDNILAMQVGSKLYLTLEAPEGHTVPAILIDRAEYDSEQEFMMECVQWARRNGGIEIK